MHSNARIPRRVWHRAVIAGVSASLGLLGAACGSSNPATTPPTKATTSSTPTTTAETSAPTTSAPATSAPITSAPTTSAPAWQIVGLGDSFTSTQNSKGQTYLDLFATSLAESSGRTVDVSDLSDDANTTARLAENLTTDDATREAVGAADIVLVSVGGNDSDPFGVYPKGTCSPKQPLPKCLETYAPTFAANYEVILSAIDELRAGNPTALRVTSADNPFVGWSEAPNPTFGVDFYAQVAEAETAAACDAAATHGGVCVDYLHIFGGPDGTHDPAKYLGSDHAHPGDLGIQAIADELQRLGVPELE